MMDIVERLRELSALEKSFPISGTCWYEKSADEIERLRNDKKDLLTQVQMLRQSMDWSKSLIFGIEQRLMTND